MGKERDVGFAVRNLSNLIRRKVDTAVQGCEKNVTGMQSRIIRYMCNNRGTDIFQRDLEERFFVRRSTMTETLHAMEKNGMITKQAVGHDARLKKLCLTAKAEELDERIRAYITKFEECMIKNIPPDEVEAFFRTVEKITANIEHTEDTEI